MKKICLAVIILAMLAGALCGCFPTGEHSVTSNADLTALQARADKLDNLTLDLKLPENIPNELPELKLTARSWDENKVKNLFLDGKTVTEHYEYPGWYNTEFGESYYLFETADNHSILYETGRLSDDINDYEKYYKYGITSIASLTRILKADEFFPRKELAGFSASAAKSMVEKVLGELGIKNFGEPEILAISAEDANNYHLIRQKSDSEYEFNELPKEIEFYVLKYPIVYEGYPLAQWNTPISQPNKTVPASYINAIVVKDEIVSLEITGEYSEEYETGEKVPIKFKPADILDIVLSRYENTVILSPVTIYDCKLIYAADKIDGKSYTFIPVWEVDLTSPDEDYGCGVMRREYYNAQTGNSLFGG